MNIAPLPASGIPTHGAAPEPDRRAPIDVRKLQMRTNATPGPRLAEAPSAELAISDETEQATEASEATQPLSPQFAALAKQRRALQVKEREIADREKAIAEKAPTQGAGVDVARLKSDPLGVLLEAGVTYDQLTEAVLASSNAPEVSALKAEVQSLKTDFDKKLSDRDTQQEQQALAEMRREALQIVATGDAFELVRETKSVPKVVELIEKTYRASGEVLGVREALQLIEDELVKDSLRLARLGKVQNQLAPQPAPQPNPQQRQMRTLANRDTASVPLGRKERALAAALGQLKR